jgi:hypothetical protein
MCTMSILPQLTKKLNKKLSFIALIAGIFLLGCGGGSSGTGVTDSFLGKVITGTVTDQSDAPVKGAEIRVVETGRATKTNSAGQFSVNVEFAGDVKLEVGIGETSSTVPVSTDGSDGGRATVKIRINNRKEVVGVTNISVTAKIVGRCDIAFENSSTIRQANSLRTNTACPVRVTVRQNGRPLSGVPFSMEYKACNARAPWKPIFEDLTDLRGIGENTFIFSNEPEFCDYRIIVPRESNGIEDFIFPVNTFQRQRLDKKK